MKIVIAKLAKRLCQERGQAMITVLLLLMLGSLTLPPILSHIGTALKTDRTYQSKTAELYAADSGIEDAIWQIKYDRLEVMFSAPEYDIYDYSANWSYGLEDTINNITTNVTIQNVWIPKDITPLNPSDARTIIESEKLIVTGTPSGATGYKIKIYFTPEEGEEEALMIESIGVWLPLGFDYVSGTSNLEQADPGEDYYSVPSEEGYAGGKAVVWDFYSAPFTSFPGVDPEAETMYTEVTFDYTPSTPDTSPVAIAWLETSGVIDVPLSWDIDTRIYKITSAAGDTEVEAYSAKYELRQMGAAISGDYRAVGNSLMTDETGDYWEIRENKLDFSSATISDIPSAADVVAAFLYWSGWFHQGDIGSNVFQDDFTTETDNWSAEDAWVHESGHFKGHNGNIGHCLTLEYSIDLSSYSEGEGYEGPGVVVSWEHWVQGIWLGWGDKLGYQYSGDGGSNWSSMNIAFYGNIGGTPVSYTTDPIPDYYLTDDFKFRFYLYDFSDYGQYCYVDNFAITELVIPVDKTAIFKINGDQVYLDGDGNPQIGTGEIEAAEWAILENQPGQYSYACNQDVTKLVQTYSNLGAGQNHTGNGVYTVGGVDADEGIDGDISYAWAYAGWSLIIIYSSPETAGHQLYLYDDFFWAEAGWGMNVDWDRDGEPGGTISGFVIPDPITGEVNAATLTCFVAEGDAGRTGDQLKFNGTFLSDGSTTSNVWNSWSEGMSEDGVDIDTFEITWASGLLEPGSTTATIDMPNPNDNWNLIYIILSLRSESSVGGTVHYLIHN